MTHTPGLISYTFYNEGQSADIQLIKLFPKISTNDQKEHSHNTHQGTGFLISTSGLLATNYHVVENSTKLRVLFANGSAEQEGKLLLVDKANDLAIIKISEFDIELCGINSIHLPYEIRRSSNVSVGEEVISMGFPFGSMLGKTSKVTSGIVSGKEGLEGDPRLFQIDTAIQPGNSGGPLFSRDGDLIGVVVSTLNAKHFYEHASIIPQNVNFAIKIDYLANLIDMLPNDTYSNSTKPQTYTGDLESMISDFSPFVVQVIAE